MVVAILGKQRLCLANRMHKKRMSLGNAWPRQDVPPPSREEYHLQVCIHDGPGVMGLIV